MPDFDEKAPEYDAWYHTKKGALVDALETACAFSLFKPEREMLILDAGCGTGNFSLKMVEMGAKVQGVDLSEPMIEYAKKKAVQSPYRERLQFQVMDLYALYFPDNTFDAVVSMAAFEFIRDNEKALKEFMRVVKPGGKVLVGTITGNSSWGEEYKSHMNRDDSVFRHAAFKTAEEMKSFLKPYLVSSAESVFLPYDITDEKTTKEWDNFYKNKGEIGAFVCCLWQKPS